MRHSILLIFVSLAALAGCVSGKPSSDSLDTMAVEGDRAQCERSCNSDYSRCMDTRAAGNSGVNGPAGMFGASAECRTELSRCMPTCKAR